MRRSQQAAQSKDWARVHIEGFNAARAEAVSAAALTQEARAAAEIEGDRAFRILDGYDSIPMALLRSIPRHESVVHLNSIVERLAWRRGFVEIRYRSAIDDEVLVLQCRQAIVTVPLGILQSTSPGRGAIRFDPEPRAILKAAAGLRYGQAYRVTFRFRDAFWESTDAFKQVGFLISRDRPFFAWWTTHPVISPLLTGWCAGSATDQLEGLSSSQVAAQALHSLGRILGRKIPRPEAAYFHNWRSDPFFLGAYSYVAVGGLTLHAALARPVEQTLFFAGEATDAEGHASTVHGAIASGLRAAEQVIQSRVNSAPTRRR